MAWNSGRECWCFPIQPCPETVSVLFPQDEIHLHSVFLRFASLFNLLHVESGDSEITDSSIQLLDVIARVQARWDFVGREEGDLSFKIGDTINVVEYGKPFP